MLRRSACQGLALSLFAGPLLTLGGCGEDDTKPRLRVLNLSSDLSSADVYLDDDKTLSAQAADAVSGYAKTDEGSATLVVKAAGDSASLLETTVSLTKDSHQTTVLWGKSASLHQTLLADDEDSPASGKTRLRVLHAGPDIGSLDVYITSSSADLDSSAAAFSGLSAGTLSSYSDLSKGSYRLRVTGAGSTTDLRLDADILTLTDKAVVTLVLTAGSGGTLVHAALIVQQGSLSLNKNTQARVRLISSLSGAPSVSANLTGTAIATSLRSPSVGAYGLVTAGSLTLNVTVSGASIAAQTLTLAAGADYSFLVTGTTAAATVTTLTEDNRLPSNTSRLKLRLINGVAGTDPLTVTADYEALVSDVDAAAGSSYVVTDARDSTQIDIATASAAYYEATDVKLAASGVYSVMLLDGKTSPTGLIRKER